MKVYTYFEHKDLEALQSSIIVERWDKVHTTGTGKRSFKAKFTEQEQKLIRSYYNTIYTWNYRTGLPQEHKMKVSTYKLLQKAVAFFATQ